MVEIEVKKDYDNYFEGYTMQALRELNLKHIKKVVVSAGPYRPYAVECKIQGDDYWVIKVREALWQARINRGDTITDEERKEYEKEIELNPDVCNVDYYSASRTGFGNLTMEMVRDCIEQCDITSGRMKEEIEKLR